MKKMKRSVLFQTMMSVMPFFIIIKLIFTKYIPSGDIALFIISGILLWANERARAKTQADDTEMEIQTEYNSASVRTVNWLFSLAVYCLSVIANMFVVFWETQKGTEISFYFVNLISFAWIFLVGFLYNLRYTLYLVKISESCISSQFIPELKKVAFFTILGFILSSIVCYICEWVLVINPHLVILILWIVGILMYQRRRSVFSEKAFLIKKPVLILTAIAIAGTVLFYNLYRDVWLIQPYINSIPNISNDEIQISYDDASGRYTIVSDKEQFRILQLSDIHLGGSAISYSKDLKALKTCYTLIEQTKPDFVIVTGDLTFPLGIMSFSFNNKAPVEQFASFMRNLGIPWAFTYGNHDSESMASLNAEELNDIFKQLSYKTSKTLLYPYMQPNITGRNNQLIEIRKSDGTITQGLFLIDSNAYTGKGVNEYDYIHDDQVDWYKQELGRLQSENPTVKSLIFMHIPLQEYRTAYDLYNQNSSEVIYYFGEIGETMIDSICASKYPSKLFDTVVEAGSTQGIFCGHDHYNNISLEYRGVRLTYGMSIDYLAMPGIERETKQRGATLILISADGDMTLSQVPYDSLG